MNNRRRNIFNALKYTWRIPRKIHSMEEFIKIYGEPQPRVIVLENDIEETLKRLQNMVSTKRYKKKIGDIICEFRDTTLYNENREAGSLGQINEIES